MYEASHWHLFIDQTERIQAVDCAGGLASSRSFAMAASDRNGGASWRGSEEFCLTSQGNQEMRHRIFRGLCNYVFMESVDGQNN
jgi:hypothetical protein